MSDAFINLLDLMRVRSTAYIAKNLSAPWGVHIDEHPALARFHFVVSGSTWIGMPETSTAAQLGEGDIAIILDGKEHTYFDDTTDEEMKRLSFPGDRSSPRFELLDRESQDTHLLCGYFEMSESTPPAILAHLPDLLIGRRSDTAIGKKTNMIVDLVREELANPTSGSEITLNRLTEILCVNAIQSWFEQNLSEDDNLLALADPKTKAVLDEIHRIPEAQWSIDTLARHYGKSRTAFTSKFKLATGLSPMNYVRLWRIKLACKMLEDSTMSIDEIAFKSGYSDTNAFNRAFKREIGSSPGAYKRAKQA